jgi:inward rectifier potassium channel
MQSYLPLFVMPWTLMHAIDETSPLHDHDAVSLVEADARVFLTLEARDQALATVVYDMKHYTADRIRFGMRYADAVTVDEAGQTTADLSRIGLLMADNGTDPEAHWAR